MRIVIGIGHRGRIALQGLVEQRQPPVATPGQPRRQGPDHGEQGEPSQEAKHMLNHEAPEQVG
jgi:hypothetical protein